MVPHWEGPAVPLAVFFSARLNDHLREQGYDLRIDRMAEISRRGISEKMAVCRWVGWGEEFLRRLTSLAELVQPAASRRRVKTGNWADIDTAIADSVRRATSDENQITQKLDITRPGTHLATSHRDSGTHTRRRVRRRQLV